MLNVTISVAANGFALFVIARNLSGNSGWVLALMILLVVMFGILTALRAAVLFAVVTDWELVEPPSSPMNTEKPRIMSISNAPVTPGWRTVGMCSDGATYDLDGINPWDYNWVSQHESIQVAHPQYPHQRHTAAVWVIQTPDRVVRFAAGEMSNNAWAFFLPTG
ncbi:MAG: hypothetical protein JWP74_3495 [Marmoricola sp.]|nr:hypothetical protein [Marmoricola sp.]